MATAVIPLKDLVQAKTRLSGLLHPTERRQLAQAMAEDVLSVLSTHAAVERVILVSDDASAPMLASYYSAQCWTEQALGGRGLNDVLTRACKNMQAPQSEAILILHADLPWLSVEDIDAALALLAGSSELVIGADRHGHGTNLLAFRAGQCPEFCFGSNSRHRHERAARAQGLAVSLLRREGIGLDVDEAGDLALLLSQPGRLEGRRLASALIDSGLAARIEPALESLRVGAGRGASGAVHGQ